MSAKTDAQNSEYFLQQSYSMMVLVTSVAYDYLLTLPSEIEYVWCKRWTQVSTLFVLVRYLSLCYIMHYSAAHSESIPQEELHSLTSLLLTQLQSQGSDFKGTIFYSVTEWTFLLFQVSADLVMILRVYALSNRSKIILGVLFFLYMLQTVTAVVFFGISNLSVVITQALNTTFCNGVLYSPLSTWSIVIPHLTFSLALFIFPFVQTLKQSLDIYKTTKRWQPNQYIKILAADGILYFFMHLCYDVRTLMVWRIVSLSAISVDFLNATTTLLLLTMLPRFIISIRELYDRDVHRQQDIDSGFGLLPFVRMPDVIASVGVGPIPEQIVGDSTGRD